MEYYRQKLDNSTIDDTYIEKLATLKGLPFYSGGNNPENISDSNHAIGLPEKDGHPRPLFDYEQLLYDTLQQHKHIWIKKTTGLGVTEFMLRYMAWLSFRDGALAGTQMAS